MPDRFRDANVSTLDLIPPYYPGIDEENVLPRFTAYLDGEFERWDDLLDELKFSRDPARATDSQVAYLFAERGFDPPMMATPERRRQALFRVPGWIRRKGDPRAVRDAIITLTGLGVESVAFWSDSRYWFFGKKKFGLETRVGIFYKPRTHNAFVSGYAIIGTHKIGQDYVNQELAYTVQLRLSRAPTDLERSAIAWAVRYFGRSEDHYDLYFPTFASMFWTVGLSSVSHTTKVRSNCWKFGVSKFGKTSVICTPCPGPPSPIVSPTSPGTWVPFVQGGGIFLPI